MYKLMWERQTNFIRNPLVWEASGPLGLESFAVVKVILLYGYVFRALLDVRFFFWYMASYFTESLWVPIKLYRTYP